MTLTYWCRLLIQLKYNIKYFWTKYWKLNFATHLATLPLEIPDFIRPLIVYVINSGEDLWNSLNGRIRQINFTIDTLNQKFVVWRRNSLPGCRLMFLIEFPNSSGLHNWANATLRKIAILKDSRNTISHERIRTSIGSIAVSLWIPKSNQNGWKTTLIAIWASLRSLC